MKSNSNQNPKLFCYTIRVAKADAVFTYFQLESHEGLCFYSTLESSLGTSYRDLEIFVPADFRAAFDHLVSRLQLQFPLQILSLLEQ